MTRLIVHAGTHKTGTTAIQTFAARHRGGLLCRGLLYPHEETVIDGGMGLSHHAFADLLTHPDADIPQATAILHQWVEVAHALDADILLSAESIYRHAVRRGAPPFGLAARREYLGRLQAVLATADMPIQFVLVFRDPVAFIQSLFQEMVAVEHRPRWQNFKSFRDDLDSRDLNPLHYRAHVAMMQGYFPDLHILVYEDLRGGDGLIRNFFARIGQDCSGLEDVDVVRQSVPPLATQLKIFVNSCQFDPVHCQRLNTWLSSPDVLTAIESQLDPGPFDLWDSAEEIADFQQAHSAEIDFLAQHRLTEPAESHAKPSLKGRPVPPITDDLKAMLLQCALGLAAPGADPHSHA
ncbi:hypothetical protein [Actibacterium sp. 188UL27-1]|uniref:hypothetical protein n=1 Tax=Actibacterium sp. 188UL27-1 TaxID=2786961 RepID=UPI001956D6E5|nr:hypothetical protein [Actibacterium sp. 188UL27-1]MBM7067396.1 hypothetical protein [Actibacterium sp. 188UL27-1]